jgi:hypothetical protein
MGFPICCNEYTRGNDCLTCFEAGQTPKYLAAQFYEMTLCPPPICNQFGPGINGRWILEQTDNPCEWHGQKTDGVFTYDCWYYCAPKGLLFVTCQDYYLFNSEEQSPCQTSFSNARILCGGGTCAVGGYGIVTINYAADILRKYGLWPERYEKKNGVVQFARTWYHKEIYAEQRSCFQFADDYKQLHIQVGFDQFLKDVEVRGMIVLWSGAVVDIPPGWHLCDGTEGTPDLRNRFVVGAGDTYDPDDSGGSETHNHTGTTNGHYHLIASGVMIGPGFAYNPGTDTKTDTFTTSTKNHLPPYYALCYIMKL